MIKKLHFFEKKYRNSLQVQKIALPLHSLSGTNKYNGPETQDDP